MTVKIKAHSLALFGIECEEEDGDKFSRNRVSGFLEQMLRGGICGTWAFSGCLLEISFSYKEKRTEGFLPIQICMKVA